jgi:hypothetical protein
MKIGAAVAIAVAAGGLAGSAFVFAARAPSIADAKQQPLAGKNIDAVWNDAKWPFPQDQWNNGRALVCNPSDCGVRVDVFLRPKIGFCNCSTGVSDDAELERVADTELVSREVAPLAAGQPIKVGWMYGRARVYRSVDGNNSAARLISFAFNDECDAVVAVARFDNGDPTVIEPAVLSLLNERPVVLWTKKELGLEFIKREW